MRNSLPPNFPSFRNMEKLAFNLSLKNIPIPPKKTYMKQLLDKTDNFVSRIRWRTDRFLFPSKYENNKQSYGFKSTRTAPTSSLLKPFEDELFEIIANLEFNEHRSQFQNKMAATVDYIKNSNNVFVCADKTTNVYEVSPDKYKKLLLDNVTKDYEQVNEREVNEVNDEARTIADRLEIADRVEVMSQSLAFISIKDHKQNFETDTKCRLINPAKSQIGILSRQILQEANRQLRSKLKLNQWQSTQDVLTWFKGIKSKSRRSFMQVDIKEYYPSISEKLLDDAIHFSNEQGIEIDPNEIVIIKNARKAFLFSENNGEKITWRKKMENGTNFDVTMGAPDGAEVCELVGLFLLSEIKEKFPTLEFGLYRDDGLAVHSRLPKRELEATRQRLKNVFANHGLEITFENPHGVKVVNFLDVTLDLTKEIHKPYRKPNDNPLYVHVDSNHPPNVIKQIPLGINKRLAYISSNEDEFTKATPDYQKALTDSGYTHKLKMPEPANPRPRTPNSNGGRKKREILYYTPPFNKALKTRIGKLFLDLVRKHFPTHHKLHPILNKNTLKLSYSCTANIKKIIQSHNRKILSKSKKDDTRKACNCQASKRDKCPLNGKCQQRNVIYKATTPNPDPHFYIGVTEDFKPRWHTHKQSFKNIELKKATCLSTFVWEKGLGPEPRIEWQIFDRAPPYQPGQRVCQLCITEKLHILEQSKKKNCLNQRSELCQICRHKASYRLGRVKGAS